MATVTDAWVRLERWLHQHTPKSRALLAEPSTSDAITRVEAHLGVAFPAELVESLRRHDGLTEWANLLPEAMPFGLRDITEQYEMRMDIAPDVDGFAIHGPSTEPWWHELWLPFGNSGYGLQIIDLRPGPERGRLGMAPTSNPADFTGGWPSLTTYLTAVADALELGGTVGEWHPYIAEDDTLWWDLGGKTEVNGELLRPASPSSS